MAEGAAVEGGGADGARRGRWGLAALWGVGIAAILAINLCDLPLCVPRMRALAGGQELLDLRLGYTPEAAQQYLAALGAIGRTRYLELLWILDLVLPALFGLVLWSTLRRGALRRWSWIGLAGGLVDYLENLALTGLLLSFPAPVPTLAWIASGLTVAKFAVYLTGVVLAAAGALMAKRRASTR
jgi:hypothetical protein